MAAIFSNDIFKDICLIKTKVFGLKFRDTDQLYNKWSINQAMA